MSDLLNDSLAEEVVTNDTVGVAVYFRVGKTLKYVALTVPKDEFLRVGLSSDNYLQGKPIKQIQDAIKKELE